PEKALEVYDQAQRKKPNDATLAKRVGLCLVKTHQYKKAINYYEAALRMSPEDFLYSDLAELFLKLKNYSKAEGLLQRALDHGSASDLPTLINDVKFLILLGETYKNSKKELVVETLSKALDVQTRILKRVPLEQPDMNTRQQQVASHICQQLADYYSEEKDYPNSLKYYKEAILYADMDNKVLLKLTHLFLIMDDLDSCEAHCRELLQDPRNKDKATMVMADIMFQKQEYEKAIEYFRQVLHKTPDNFTVMCKFIDLLRRSGKLADAQQIFDMALEQSSRTTLEPGYNFCKGLYSWHIGQPNEALKYFNKARKDNDWGQRAITNMIQICLNPDNEIVGGEVFDNLEEDNSVLGEKRDSEKLGVRTAEKLLKEFHPRTTHGHKRLIMLQCYCLMATRDKGNIETALSTLTEMANTESSSKAYEYLGFIMEKEQSYKDAAENYRLAWEYSSESSPAVGFRLAFNYLKDKKYVDAIDICRKVLKAHPTYPKMRKEIMDKAQTNLKP
ncbi:hypothetical protein GDO81_012353, partial [Engystomops pustulosus]